MALPLPKSMDIKSPQVDGLLMGREIRKLQEENRKLWKRYSNNTYAWYWPRASIAPTATIDDNSSTFSFDTGGTLGFMIFPWHIQEGFNAILINCTFGVSKTNFGFKFHIALDDFVGAEVAITTCEINNVQSTFKTPPGGWVEEVDYYLAKGMVLCKPDNMTSTRTFTIYPYLSIQGEISDPYSTTVETLVKFYSFHIRDVYVP